MGYKYRVRTKSRLMDSALKTAGTTALCHRQEGSSFGNSWLCSPGDTWGDPGLQDVLSSKRKVGAPGEQMILEMSSSLHTYAYMYTRASNPFTYTPPKESNVMHVK